MRVEMLAWLSEQHKIITILAHSHEILGLEVFVKPALYML